MRLSVWYDSTKCSFEARSNVLGTLKQQFVCIVKISTTTATASDHFSHFSIPLWHFETSFAAAKPEIRLPNLNNDPFFNFIIGNPYKCLECMEFIGSSFWFQYTPTGLMMLVKLMNMLNYEPNRFQFQTSQRIFMPSAWWPFQTRFSIIIFASFVQPTWRFL